MIIIYKDPSTGNVVYNDGLTGSRAVNTLHATGNGDGTVNVFNKFSLDETGDQLKEFFNIAFSEFVDENENPYGATEQETVNSLNTMMVSSGDILNPPQITSPTSINSVSGEVINYELTADYGVAYEWGNLPSGLITVDGNTRRLIGSLPSGTYTPTMKAVNYIGSDEETLTINVSNPPFANTKSVNFVNLDYLSANALLVSDSLERIGSGSGASDAWTISFWFKAGTSSNSEQTIFYFGDSNQYSNGNIRIVYNGSKNRIELLYGNYYNNILIRSVDDTISVGQWSQFIITYDGGTTGSSSGEINDYYSRFKIFKDGAELNYNNTNSNYGYNSDVDAENCRIGRHVYSDYMRNNCRVDEFAIFNSDQQSNVAAIYNGGEPFDLSALPNPPSHWWRMGDDDTYPVLSDNIGSADFLMINMTQADIVNDTP